MTIEMVAQDDYPQELAIGRPKSRANPTDDVFEIGLVLAGAVSAGAYTAGVLDFLFEALEAWQDAKAAGRDVPRHEVKIRVITGASAGAISGAIAATALRYRFPHCSAKKLDPTNPLFKAWVEDIDITKLLETGDLTRNPLPHSLFDTSCLTRIAADAIGYSNAPLADRPYVADPLKLIFTVTNLCGVPTIYYWLQEFDRIGRVSVFVRRARKDTRRETPKKNPNLERLGIRQTVSVSPSKIH